MTLVLFLSLWYTIGPGNSSNTNNPTAARPNKFGQNGQGTNSATVTENGSNHTLIATVQMKSNAHPWFGMGSPFGYAIHGQEGRPLTLTAGQTYTIVNEASCEHPLYISSSAIGAGQGIVEEGVVYPNNNPRAVCNGTSLKFTPTSSQIGQPLWYQCTNHAQMGGTITIVA